MKKMISFVAISTLVSSFFITGCGGNASQIENDMNEAIDVVEEIPSGDISLTLWGSEEDGELLAKITSEFVQEHSSEANISITIESVSESNCRDAVLDDVNNCADVFTFADDQLSSLVASGVLSAVEYELDSVKSRNSQSSVDAASINGVLYAYPLTADNGYFMYYNKAFISESDVATMDGLLAAAAANGKQVTMDMGSGWYLYAFFGNTGLEVGVNPDGLSNFCSWNSVEGPVRGVDVAEAIMALGANGALVNGGDTALLDGAADGTVVAGVSGVWNATALEELWGSNMAAAKLPTYTVSGQQIQMSSYAGYKMIGVNDYSPNKYWAERLAEFITNEANQSLRFTMRGTGPSNSVAAASPEVAASPAIQALIAQSEFASLQRIGGAYWSPAADLGNALYNGDVGGLDMQEFLDNTVAEITASNN